LTTPPRPHTAYLGAVRPVSTALGIVALCAVAAAATAQATSTHDEYVAQVNPICKSAAKVAKRKLDHVKSTGNPFFDYLLRARLYGKLLGKAIHHIATVPPVPGEEAQVKSWLDEGRRTVRLINRLLGLFGHHPSAHRVKSLLKQIGVSQRAASRQASALGLRACSGPKRLS
jgi:hypothetical protein